MLTHRFLFAGFLLALSGCAAHPQPKLDLPPGTPFLRSQEQVDGGMLHRIDCWGGAIGTPPGEYASTEVSFVVLPSGKVAPGSAYALGGVRRYSAGYPPGEAPPVSIHRAQEETVREHAKVQAEACVFEPPLKHGQPVAVRARYRFRVTI